MPAKASNCSKIAKISSWYYFSYRANIGGDTKKLLRLSLIDRQSKYQGEPKPMAECIVGIDQTSFRPKGTVAVFGLTILRTKECIYNTIYHPLRG